MLDRGGVLWVNTWGSYATPGCCCNALRNDLWKFKLNVVADVGSAPPRQVVSDISISPAVSVVWLVVALALLLRGWKLIGPLVRVSRLRVHRFGSRFPFLSMNRA